jgi:hypothetical protein
MVDFMKPPESTSKMALSQASRRMAGAQGAREPGELGEYRLAAGKMPRGKKRDDAHVPGALVDATGLVMRRFVVLVGLVERFDDGIEQRQAHPEHADAIGDLIDLRWSRLPVVRLG